jgi:hypothetical protein
LSGAVEEAQGIGVEQHDAGGLLRCRCSKNITLFRVLLGLLIALTLVPVAHVVSLALLPLIEIGRFSDVFDPFPFRIFERVSMEQLGKLLSVSVGHFAFFIGDAHPKFSTGARRTPL